MEEDLVAERVHAVFARGGARAWHMETDTARCTSKKSAFIRGSRSLKEARRTLASAKPEEFAEDEEKAGVVTKKVEVRSAPVSQYQCQRMVSKSISKARKFS